MILFLEIRKSFLGVWFYTYWLYTTIQHISAEQTYIHIHMSGNVILGALLKIKKFESFLVLIITFVCCVLNKPCLSSNVNSCSVIFSDPAGESAKM